jgi:hypothetical protein
MGALDEQRLVEVLGGPVPADPAEAAKALRERTVELKDAAKRSERAASVIPALVAAIAEADHDIVLRTSPELRRLQDRGEALRLRKHRARAGADRVVVNLAHWQHTIESGTSSQRPSPAPREEDEFRAEDLPQVSRMKAMLDEFKRVRYGTDRIGRDA